MSRRAVVRALGGTVVAVALALPGEARGQLAWDAPFFVHPYAPHGWTIALAEPHPGREVAVTALWRTAAVPVGFGVRVGLGEGADGDLAIYGGVDATGSLIRRSDATPLDLIWAVGGGLGVAHDVLVSIPAGLIAGWDLPVEGIRFLPYVGPRVVLDAWIGGADRGEGDDLDLDAVVDLGCDVVLAGGWVVRLGITAGDREALGVGVTLPAAGRR